MLIACLLNLLGFAWLALAQERYQDPVYGHSCSIARVAIARRAIGSIAIGMSLPACMVSQGASFGCLLWPLSMGAAAMAVALTLSWRPRWLRVAWPWP